MSEDLTYYSRPKPKLTKKQQIAWELQQEGNTYNEIAALMGIKRGVVKKHLRAVRDKMGYKKLARTDMTFGEQSHISGKKVRYKIGASTVGERDYLIKCRKEYREQLILGKVRERVHREEDSKAWRIVW